MKKIVMEGPKKSKIIEVDIPKINDDQLLVKLKYTGMCHSEWYPWSIASPDDSFGHEPMGVVVEVGKNVEGFKSGDRVSGLGGGYSEYIAMDAAKTVLVPDNVSDEDAVVEPLSCLISIAERVPIFTLGDSVALVGAGYMGLGIISLLRLKGAGKIVVIDPSEEARENAVRFGAAETHHPAEVPHEYILNWDNWKKTDIFNTGFKTVVEFSGTEKGLNLAGDMVSAHGFLGIGGYHNDGKRTVDFKLWNVKALTVNNLHEKRSAYQVQCCKTALSLLSMDLWNFKGTCSHIYSMNEFDRANHDLVNKPKGYLKGLVRCD